MVRMTRADTLALLKVLVAAAWADSRIGQSEVNYLKSLAKRFNLTDEDWLALQPYLEDPPTPKDIEALFEDLVYRIATPLGRDQVIHHLEEMLKADATITSDEHDFLEEYVSVLKQTSTAQLLAGRLKGLFQKRPAVAVIDLDEFVKNKVFFKLRRRIGVEQVTPEMYRLCLLGGLMGVVAQADGEIAPAELQEIRHRLQSRGSFEQEALDTLMAIIEDESVRGLDRARLISDYTADLGFEERIDLLDLLFAVAVADGGLTHAELEELRGISAALHLSHRQYINAKLRAKQ
jgi:uncharacterized tellurite resistance protein B-like protein